MKSIWQEHVDTLDFKALSLDEAREKSRLWRNQCGHVNLKKLDRSTQPRIFLQNNCDVVCQLCALQHVRSLNNTRRRLYTAQDLGEFASLDSLEKEILRLWDEKLILQSFGFHFDQLETFRNPNPDGITFGSCVYGPEQISKIVGFERERLAKLPRSEMKYRLFRYYGNYARWDIQVIAIGKDEQFDDTDIFADIYADWQMIDATTNQLVWVKSGAAYELERIANPYGHKVPWLVLKGTKIGMAETFWIAQRPGRLDDDPMSNNFGKPLTTTRFDIDLYYEGDLPQMAVIKK